MTTITGTSGNDSLLGTDGADTLEGLAGQDTLEGLGSYDYLYGQEGNDSLSGGDGDDQLYGGPGDDTLDGGTGNDWGFFGSKSGPIVANLMTGQATGEGTDRLIGIENISGSDADDQLTGDDLENLLRGNFGRDTLVGGGGNDTLDGGWGYQDADHLQGGDGDDVLMAYGPDTLDGGAGLDKVMFDTPNSGVDFDLSTGIYVQRPRSDIPFDASESLNLEDNTAFKLQLLNIEQIEGSYYADLIKGDDNDNQLFGGGGNDTLYGGAGDDVLAGDYFEGGKGGAYLNTMNVIDGGDGMDTVVYVGSRDQVFVTILDASNTYAISYGLTYDLVEGVEKIRLSDGLFDLAELARATGEFTGSEDSDTIYGSPGNDTLLGLAGPDFLYGQDGDDSLVGGDDSDQLYGGLGDDTLDGDKGSDTANYQNSTAAITVNLSIGVATGEGTDRLIGIENITGSRFDDQLTGGAQDNWLWGGDGSDTLEGGVGNDSLDGGWGTWADHLKGEDGDDVLSVRGPDTLDGGPGLDRIRFADIHGGVDVDLANSTYVERNSTNNIYVLSFWNIEQIEGSSDDDMIRGDANNNQLFGGPGHDTLYGGAGDDVLSGSNGSYHWSAEQNIIYGDEGTDTAVYESRRDQVFVTAQDTPGSYAISYGLIYDLVNGVEKIRLSDGLFDLAELARAKGDFTGGDISETITGSPGDDTIEGRGGNDRLNGLEGNDSLSGGEGDEWLFGGPGDDTLDGGSGNDWASYGNSNRAVTANLNTGVATGEGTDTLIDIENIEGSRFNDHLTGDSLANWLRGNGGSDTLIGGGGNDILEGGWGAEAAHLQGGDGDDVLSAYGSGTLDGGDGRDVVRFAWIYGGVDFDWSTGIYFERRTPANSYLQTLLSIEEVVGSWGDDVIRGDANDNVIVCGSGSDTLYGGGGDDVLHVGDTHWNQLKGSEIHGDIGTDTVVYKRNRGEVYVQLNDEPNSYSVFYGDLADKLYGVEKITFNDGTFNVADVATARGVFRGNDSPNWMVGSSDPDTLEGFGGDDTLAGGLGDDRLDGGAGYDTANYRHSLQGVTVNLSTGQASGHGNDALISMEGIWGSDYADQLTGDDQDNELIGHDGNDTLVGGGGNDGFSGGAGADSQDGGDGNDWMTLSLDNDTANGGAGWDSASFEDALVSVEFDLATGIVTSREDPARAAEITLISIEQIGGSFEDDVIRGDAGHNNIFGDYGNDTLYGGAGDDVLDGGAEDFFFNSKGSFKTDNNNVIYGGDGVDTVLYHGSRQHVLIHARADADSYRVSIGASYDILYGVEKIQFTEGTFDLSDLAAPEGLYVGSDQNDSLMGSSADDTMEGLAGSDRLDGQDGDDSISGGAGDDSLSGGLGNDSLDGGADNDWANYSASQTVVTVNLLTGIATGEGADVLIGIENIAGSNFGDDLWGDNLSNFIGGNGGDDTLNGGAGNDTLDGDEGADHLKGGDGDDVLVASLDADTLDGGAGHDQLSFASILGYGVEFSLANKTLAALSHSDNPTLQTVHQLTLVSIEEIKGTQLADVLIGDANNNTLIGGYGSDTLYGGAGDDVLYADDEHSNPSGGNVLHGGEGSDTAMYRGQRQQFSVQLDDAPNSYRVIFGGGSDTLHDVEKIGFDNGTFDLSALATAKGLIRGTDQADYLTGTDGNDTLEGLAGDDRLFGRLGNDLLDGGAGNDWADYGSSTAINANLNTGLATGEGSDTLVGIENIEGSGFGDDLTGDAQANSLRGHSGSDTLYGGAGNDTLDGGWDFEADSILGGNDDDLLIVQGSDTLDGGAGQDKIQFNSSGGVEFNLITGVYFERQTPATSYTLTLSSIEQIEGTAHADVLTGDANDNQLFGSPGDTLYGGAGDDLLHGGFFYAGKYGDLPAVTSVHGDGGIDTFVLSGMRNQVRVHLGEIQESYEVFVPLISWSGSYSPQQYAHVATLYGIEKVQLSDGIFDISELATAKGFIKGTDQNDYLMGTFSNETLEGLAGNDQLFGESGQDLLLGGDGDDSLSGGPGDDTSIGGSGNDTLRGDFGDSLTGTDGLDSVMGGDGDDLIHAAIDNDTLDGGSGKDKLSFANVGFNGWSSPLSGVDFNLATGVVFPKASPEIKRTLNVFNIEQFEGSPYADVITGDVNDNELFGAGGNDTLYGGDGNDLLHGDTSFFFTGKESYSLNPASDELHGGNGTDTITYAGNRGHFFVNRLDGLNNFTIAAGSSVDMAYGVEKIRFNDGTFDLSAIASAQGVYKGTEQSDTITGWTGNDTIEGFGGDDVLQGHDGKDSLSGGEGNDLLRGSRGDDTLDGGAGNDTLDGSHSSVGGTANLQTGWASVEGSNVLLISIENIFGSRFNDLLTGNGLANALHGNDGVDTLAGGGGNDTLDGGAGADLLQGGDGDDVLLASLDNDTLDGGAGQDRIRFDGSSGGVDFDLATSTLKLLQQSAVAYTLNLISIEQIEGSAGADLITGDANNNELFGGGGNDTLYGSTGNDTLHGGSQIALFGGKGTNDVLYGGAGIDTVVYSGNRNEVIVRILDVPGAYQITYGTSLDTAYEVEKIRFSDGIFDLSAVADPKGLFRGTANANYLIGSSDHETMLGLAGDDTLNGLDGDDSLSAGDGDDQLLGGLGDDTIDGGAGNDWVSFLNSSNNINANLGTGLATGEGSDTLVGIENIDGSSFNDVLTGNAQPNWLRASSGSDTLDGGAGNDTLDGGLGYEADSLRGGDGDDVLIVQGHDTLDGGTGQDKVQFNSNGGVDFNLMTGVYFERQTPGTLYRLDLSNIEQVEGTGNADVLTGDASDNQLFGAAGSDTLHGGAGNDLLDGGFFYVSKAGVPNDVLYGGDGNDTLVGGSGQNLLDGGNGFDTAVFSGKKSQYVITREADNTVVVRNISASGLNEVSTLVGIEQLKFADVDFTLGQPIVSGRVYHWKSHALLSNVIVDVLGPVTTAAAIPTASQHIQFKSPVLDTAKGKFTFEVWAHSSSVVDAFTFTIKNAAGLSAVFSSDALGSGWVVLNNAAESPKNFTVAGFVETGLATNSAGHFQLGTVSIDLPAGTVLPTTVMEGAELNASRVPNASLSFERGQSDQSGLFSILPTQNGQFEMNVSRAAVDSGNAITAADALAALRIAVGLNPNPDPDGSGPMKALMTSPYQIMAADVNQNGQVTSADALAILRMAVRLNSAPAQEWFFVDEKRDFWNESNQTFNLNRSQSNWASAMHANSESLDNHNLVGVLKGDVNGSWSAPTGSQFMTTDHPSYVSDMARLMGVPTDQWGVASSGGQTFTLT